MRMARELCPEAVVIRGNTSAYSRHSREVTEIVKEEVPVLEKASIDEFYADLSGMGRFFSTQGFASELRHRIIRETGLPISLGLSVNKTVSKVATGEAKPNNERYVHVGGERSFLRPLSIRKIPMVGKKTYAVLRDLGIYTVGTLQEMPVDMLQSVMGKHGSVLWHKAQGVDPSPVVQTRERKSISTERTFEQDRDNAQELKGTLSAMAENLAYQLRRAGKVTGNLAVKVRYSDFQTYSKQRSISYTAADHNIIPVIMELFNQVHQRRVRIRLVGIRLSDLVNGGEQYGLFEVREKERGLYDAMDQIRNRFGDRAILRANGIQARSVGRYNPFSGEPPILLANRRQ